MYVHCPVYTVHCTSYTSWLKVNSRNNGTAVKVTREIFCNLFLQEHLLLVAVFWGVWLCSCCHADPPGMFMKLSYIFDILGTHYFTFINKITWAFARFVGYHSNKRAKNIFEYKHIFLQKEHANLLRSHFQKHMHQNSREDKLTILLSTV